LRIKGTMLILLTACLGTALAMNSKDQEDSSSGVVGAVTKEVRTHGDSGSLEQQSSEMHFDLSAIKRSIPKDIRTSGLFESKSWYVPPPVQAVLVPVQMPSPESTTPSLPFAFIGRMVDGNDVTLFLSQNDRQYAVKEKDILDNIYRVDKISESEVVLTYLPTNTQQILQFNTNTATGSPISTSALNATLRPVTPPQKPNPN